MGTESRLTPHLIGGGLLVLAGVSLGLWSPMEPTRPATSLITPYTGPVQRMRYVDPGPRGLTFGASEPVQTVALPSASTAPQLVGLMGAREAYLRGSVNGTVERLTVGDTVDGWTLSAVRARSVVLTQGSERYVATLYAQTEAGRTSAGTASQPQPSTSPSVPITLTPPAGASASIGPS